MQLINLTKGQVAQVSDEDFEYLSRWKWRAQYSDLTESYYAVRNEYRGGPKRSKQRKKVAILMHREVMRRMLNRTRLSKKKVVDHINHDTLKNTRDNLRYVSYRQNMQNLRKNKSSKYPGVSWNTQKQKWVSQIRVDGEIQHLDFFDIEEDAAEAYKTACQDLIGEKLIHDL